MYNKGVRLKEDDTMDRTLDNRTVYIFNKRGGKLVKSASGMGRGMVGYWALQTTTKGRIAVMVFTDTNEIERVYIGRENACPKVIHLEKMPQYNFNLNDYINDETHIDVHGLMLMEELEG